VYCPNIATCPLLFSDGKPILKFAAEDIQGAIVKLLPLGLGVDPFATQQLCDSSLSAKCHHMKLMGRISDELSQLRRDTSLNESYPRSHGSLLTDWSFDRLTVRPFVLSGEGASGCITNSFGCTALLICVDSTTKTRTKCVCV
jgi:hypothetical protein